MTSLSLSCLLWLLFSWFCLITWSIQLQPLVTFLLICIPEPRVKYQLANHILITYFRKKMGKSRSHEIPRCTKKNWKTVVLYCYLIWDQTLNQLWAVLFQPGPLYLNAVTRVRVSSSSRVGHRTATLYNKNLHTTRETAIISTKDSLMKREKKLIMEEDTSIMANLAHDCLGLCCFLKWLTKTCSRNLTCH
jgi:hypothetical protein